ncbi:MAG: hypothetical protein WAP23_01675 [Candidatus Spechtbacterales bacterium]
MLGKQYSLPAGRQGVGTENGAKRSNEMTTQRETSKRLTWGETLFPKETIEGKYHHGTPILFEKIWQFRGTSTHEIGDALFLLKRSTGSENVDYAAFCIEKVFEGLTDPYLVKRILKTFPDYPDRIFQNTNLALDLAKHARESLGELTLEVFFEVIFPKNKDMLWEYLVHNANQPRMALSPPDRPPDPARKIQEWLEQTALFTFLNYFAGCNETTKHNHRGDIRKFLRNVYEEPLMMHGEKIGISDWSNNARFTLAEALVANSMYEECLEYDLPEAYQGLTRKFLGVGFIEGEDGLAHLYVSDKKSSPEKAMTKALENKEWAHIWSVITRMAYKYEQAHFARIIDHNDPGIAQGHTNVPLELAFVFKNGLTDAHGVYGF